MLTTEEVEKKGIRSAGQLYGRVPHNIYAQILAELGVVGALAFLAMLASFLTRNRKTARPDTPESARRMPWRAAYAKGVLGAMLVFLVNGLVYDILYYHWFQDLLIMNYALSQESDPGPQTSEAQTTGGAWQN